MGCEMVTAADVVMVAGWLDVMPSRLLALRPTRRTIKQDARVDAERLAEAE